MRKHAATCALFALIVLPHGAKADPGNGSFTFQVENDYFSPNNRDRHYTSGVRFEWLPPPSEIGDEGPLETLAKEFPFGGAPDNIGRVGWSFGQSLFTPQNTATAAPQPRDRPYAGWLYAGFSLLNAERQRADQANAIVSLDSLEVDLGIVGPDAEGKFVQTLVHDILPNNTKPRGWKNQIHDEPGILLSYDHKWRSLIETSFGGLGVDLTPDLGADLGNIDIAAMTGLTLRIGRDLPADYGPPRIRPGLAGSDFFLSDSESGRDFGWYLFAGILGRAVAHDIFLDGNSAGTSPHVTKKTLVGDVQGGLALILYGARFSATVVRRTKEFVGQVGMDSFGSVAISFNF